MAPLYKRYVPPNSGVPESVSTATGISQSDARINAEAPDTKRKRERTQEEIAERKSKKLKKKGVVPKFAHETNADSLPTAVDGADDLSVKAISAKNATDGAPAQSQGDFAHIKNDKKRHRLEKEARKARKKEGQERKALVRDAQPNDEPKHGTSQTRAGTKSMEEMVEAGNGHDQENSSVEAEVGLAHPGGPEEQAGKLQRKNLQNGERTAEGSGDKPTATVDDQSGDISLRLVESTVDSERRAAAPKLQKRRHRLEAALAESPAKAKPDDGEEIPHKHSGLLDKFQKSLERSTQSAQELDHPKHPQQLVVRDLELPEPGENPTPEFLSEHATLPPWLARPTVVSAGHRVTFEDLGVKSETNNKLAGLGFSQALPVQSALIPLLLQPGSSGSIFPAGTEDVLPDIAIGAPTGSGKTIAYLLPIIEALAGPSKNDTLRALIIVPTQELVLQVAAVADSLSKGSGLRIGMATGTRKFKDEQNKLIQRGCRYDREAYRDLMLRAKRVVYPPEEDPDAFYSHVEQNRVKDLEEVQLLKDATSGPFAHVPTYKSAIDVLVATPGRLLEHLNGTLGFSLAHLKWLIIDEADKLLDNQYESFLESINMELTRSRYTPEQNAREKYLRSEGCWDDRGERKLRKVVLSATMTSDISKLISLKLQRPQMILVRGVDEVQAGAMGEDDGNADVSFKESPDVFELPRTLVEYCVPVGDGSEKPLVAVELLSSKVFNEPSTSVQPPFPAGNGEGSQGESDNSESDTDDTSSISSDDSTSSSEVSSTNDSGEDDGDSSGPQSSAPRSASTSGRLAVVSADHEISQTARVPTVLIFTSSNESANRLTHLLQGLKPSWSSRITTLVKSNPGRARLRCKSNEPAIVVSTDRGARGLDSFSDQKGAKRPITHVIQYDVPRSVTSYVHRVGRTARAGGKGDAWTLYTHPEARWFVTEITKAHNVKRAGAVERVKVFMQDDGMREQYQQVLAGMREEVFGGGSG